jgi:hypothetical protein
VDLFGTHAVDTADGSELLRLVGAGRDHVRATGWVSPPLRAGYASRIWARPTSPSSPARVRLESGRHLDRFVLDPRSARTRWHIRGSPTRHAIRPPDESPKNPRRVGYHRVVTAHVEGVRAMEQAEFRDPRLVAVYDAEYGWSRIDDFFLGVAKRDATRSGPRSWLWDRTVGAGVGHRSGPVVSRRRHHG